MRHGDSAAVGDCGLGLRLSAAGPAGGDWDLMDRFGGGTMELRISIRSLVHQLVHEQAKASVHLEGLQRDVSTLLDFRDNVMSRSLGPACPSSPSTRTLVGRTTGAATVPGTPTEHTDPASTGASSGLGTSAGTSAASAAAAAVTTAPSVGGCSGGGGEFGGPVADGDELMSLLETIEAHGRRLVRQTQRDEASGAPGSSQTSESAASAAASSGGARPRCSNCDRTDGHGRGAGSIPGAGGVFGARRRTPERRRPSDHRMTSDGPEADHLADWMPGWDRSPLLGDPPPLSLPDLRPGQERLAALSLSERLLQERDALLAQLTGLEQVAVRSQLHAASIQTRLHRVLAVNDALDRELRLAGGQRLLAGSAVPAPVHGHGHGAHNAHGNATHSATAHGNAAAHGRNAAEANARAASRASAAEERMARSTPDLRPPSRIPQPVSLRRQPGGRDLRLARPRSPASPASSATRRDASLQPVGGSQPRPRSRSRDTQTSYAGVGADAASGASIGLSGAIPRLVDRSVNATATLSAPTTPVVAGVDQATSYSLHMASVGTCMSLPPSPLATAATSATSAAGAAAARAAGEAEDRRKANPPRAVRAPDRGRVSAILNETSPLKLQRELLTLLVEAESLRAQVDSLGRRWKVRGAQPSVQQPTQRPVEPSDQPLSEQTDSDDIRLQLEMRNIELEGTRARLRQLEAAWATRSAPTASSAASAAASATFAATAAASASSRTQDQGAMEAGRGAANPASGAARPRPRAERVMGLAGLSPGVERPLSPSTAASAAVSATGVTSTARPRTPALGRAPVAAAAAAGAMRAAGGAGRPSAPPTTAAPPGGVVVRPSSAGSAPVRRPNGGSTGGQTVANSTTGAAGATGSPGLRSGSPSVRSASPSVRSGSPGVRSGSPARPVPVSGRRVADLVRGWTEAVTVERPAVDRPTSGTPPNGGGGRQTPSGGGGRQTQATDQPELRDKVRRRLNSETSAKIPATQSQALGQILTALSRGHSPRVPLRRASPTTATTTPPSDNATPDIRADVRRLRELRGLTAQRLRGAPLETSDGEVADSLTSLTASEEGGDVSSIDERLKLVAFGTGGCAVRD